MTDQQAKKTSFLALFLAIATLISQVFNHFLGIPRAYLISDAAFVTSVLYLIIAIKTKIITRWIAVICWLAVFILYSPYTR